jgi:hypothetical protein
MTLVVSPMFGRAALASEASAQRGEAK